MNEKKQANIHKEKQENALDNDIIKKYNKIVTIWNRFDESYWSSFHIFIIIMGLLFATFSQLYTQRILAIIISALSIISIIIWLFILNRKYILIVISQQIGIELENRIYQGYNWKGCFSENEIFKKELELKNPNHQNSILQERYKKHPIQMKFVGKSSGVYSALVFPLFLILIWLVLLVYSFIYLIIDC